MVKSISIFYPPSQNTTGMPVGDPYFPVMLKTVALELHLSQFKGHLKQNAKWEIQAMVSLDLRNLIIPFCLLKASNAFRSLKKDDVLEILCSDTENLRNLMKIFPSDSCELISAKDLKGPGLGLKVRMRKINP